MERIAITERDVRQMLHLTRRYGEDDGEALPWELMHDLRQLVPCDMLEASFQDTPRWEIRDQQLPRHEFPPAEEASLAEGYKVHYWQSGCSYPDRTGDLTPVTRVSDHVSDREWHSSGMYADCAKAMGVERELMVWLDAGGPQRTLRLLFSRGPGADFSPRDVAVLTLLRPHLQAAYIAAERHRRGMLPLTRRQREILQYVAAGYSNRQIARRLEVSETTVRTHLENIFARLEVNSRTAAVARLGQPMLAAEG
jgi:DNA-binding CsgD family transcriptional regulator